jgi:hypothetical protein
MLAGVFLGLPNDILVDTECDPAVLDVYYAFRSKAGPHCGAETTIFHFPIRHFNQRRARPLRGGLWFPQT